MGFRKVFRSADHVLTLKTLTDKYLNRNQKFYICFVDFRKAYDSIWYRYLFHKLCMYGIHRNFISLLEDVYMKSKLSIHLPNGTTHFFPSSTGLKQGCNLSPILFNLFINDIGDIFDQDQCQPLSILKLSLNHLLYADDLVLIPETKNGLQQCLNKLQKYCEKNRITVNNKKTKVMIVQKKLRS